MLFSAASSALDDLGGSYKALHKQLCFKLNRLLIYTVLYVVMEIHWHLSECSHKATEVSGKFQKKKVAGVAHLSTYQVSGPCGSLKPIYFPQTRKARHLTHW